MLLRRRGRGGVVGESLAFARGGPLIPPNHLFASLGNVDMSEGPRGPHAGSLV